MSLIYGTGVDIIEIARIKRAIERWGEEFLHHVFTDEEIAYAQNRPSPGQHFAARLAAKEAVLKAMGDNRHVHWKDLQISHDGHGRPVCIYKKRSFKQKIHISISHSEHYAVASAIITS